VVSDLIRDLPTSAVFSRRYSCAAKDAKADRTRPESEHRACTAGEDSGHVVIRQVDDNAGVPRGRPVRVMSDAGLSVSVCVMYRGC